MSTMTARAPQSPATTALPQQRASSYSKGARAEVLGISDQDNVLVRLHQRTPEEVFCAELAVPHYEPLVGDRVLVESFEDGWFVIGILGEARRRTAPEIFPGLTAKREGPNVEILVKEGSLTLSAVGGIALRSEKEVDATAPAIHIAGDNVVVEARRHEVIASRVVERAGDAYTHVEGLVEVSAGRARTLVTGDHDLFAGRTTIRSDEDTIVDGERVLLG